MHVRVCVDCGEEYRPEVERCADCGGELEDRMGDDGVDSAVGAAPIPHTPTEPLQRIFFSEKSDDLRPLAERLGRAGVPFAVKAAVAHFELLVGESDIERAKAAFGDLVAPETESAAQAGDDAVTPTCPACDSPLPGDVEECPQCGLGLSG